MNTKLIVAALAVGGVGLFAALTFFGDGDHTSHDDYEHESETGEEVTEEAAVPAEVPANVPMYPGAVVAATQEANDATAQNITLTLHTPDSVADVNTWYRGALSEGGWAVTSDKNVGGYILLKGENGNIAVFTQAAARSDLGVTVITERIQIK